MEISSLIRNTPISIIILDKSGKVLSINKSMEDLTGYETEGLEKRVFWKLRIFKDQNRDKIKNFFKKTKKLGKHKLKEIQIRIENGSSIWVSIMASIMDMKNLNHILVIFQDINERKEKEKRLKMLENEIRDVILILDLDLNHQYISPSVERLRGFTPEEIKNMSFKEKHTPASHKKMLNLKKKYLTPENLKDENFNPTITEEFEIYCKDGSTLPIEVKMRLLRNDNGKATKIIGVSRDISERKGAELRYKRLFQTSRDAIMTLEPPHWRFSSGNPTAIEMFGAENEEDFCSRAPWEFSTKVQPDGQDSVEKAKKMIDKAMSEGSNFFEWTHKRLDGDIFPATVLLSRIEISGKQFLQATVRDITERKEAEKKLIESRRKLEDLNLKLEEKIRERTKKLRISKKILRKKNQKLKKLSSMKDDFITMVAHELKTPIASIYGYIDYLLSIYPNHNDAEMKGDLKVVQRNVNRLRKYVNQLLDVMKIEESKIKLYKSSVDLSDLIKNCIDELSYLIKEKNLNLELDLENELVLQIDEERIFQVLSNLISNSVKFTPEGGNIFIDTYKKGNRVYFEIRDNGIGLTEEELNSLFKKFEKYDVGVDNYPRGKGTGLGLFISKGIIKAHDGAIWAHSKGKGKGTKFTFYLPLAKEAK